VKPAQVLELLALEAIEVDIFRAGGIPGQAARLYGGQVAAQALAAAGYTAGEARPHSLHAYFLSTGSSRASDYQPAPPAPSPACAASSAAPSSARTARSSPLSHRRPSCTSPGTRPARVRPVERPATEAIPLPERTPLAVALGRNYVTNASHVDFYAPGKHPRWRILGAMADEWGEEAARRAKAALIDTTVPNAARVTDYLYGGQNNFAADRKAARAMAATAPVIAAIAPAVRAFQRRVLRFLVAEAGIRQFLDVGTGLPLVGNTHEVAQSLVPECRIVYVDNDPMVLSHARALLRSAPGGAVGYIDADVRDPGAIVAGARATLDLSQPAAVLLLFTLAFIGGGEAAAVVSSLMAAVPSGSYVAIYHLASDLDPALEDAAWQWNRMMPAQPITLRCGPEVADLAAGLDPVPPGLVPVTEWRPAPADPRFEHAVPVHGIVARKP
jgi:hypothetical protein